jgi:hypothetical protein
MAWVYDEYSQPTLPDPADKLPAVATIAAVFNDETLGDYLADVWSRNIAAALAWSRVYNVLKPSPVYRAPSWSWASVDGLTSSLLLAWPENPLSWQATDKSWINSYGLELIRHHMILIDTTNLYLGVQEGSHIVLEATYLGFEKLTDWVNADKERDEIFQMNPIIDQSWVFDCACCGHHTFTVEARKERNLKLQKDVELHICMVLQGDGWQSYKSTVDMLVLKRMDGEEGGWGS